MKRIRETSVPIRDAKQQTAGWLRWLNLRSEESERTFLMFAFYLLSSVGILWLEFSAAALFLGEYGAESLPWIYIASAVIGIGLGFIYSWVQKVLPLRQVIVCTAVLMALPLLLFRLGLNPALMGGYTIFLMRLWLEAVYVINELNTSITANQLFTIREIKRTYPLISSGILAADVISGFSLPLMRELVGLPNVILLACFMMLLGAGILLHLTRVYRQFFPDFSRRRLQDNQRNFAARGLQGPFRQYVVLIVAFFVMTQVLALLLDFQYFNQLEQGLEVRVEKIADFLALFSATLGIFELLTQWFVSGRVIERLGVFTILMLPPVLVTGLCLLTLTGLLQLFAGIIALKFVDELLRYTIVASTGPVLFQPLPDHTRNWTQSIVRGVAEPLSTGLTGLGMLATFWTFEHVFGYQPSIFQPLQSLMFLLYTFLFAALWLLTVVQLRSKYLEVLVLGAERSQLSLSEVDLRTFKRNIIEALERSNNTEAEKKSCIELLTHIDPKSVAEVLSPLLPNFPPALQRDSLEAMLTAPSSIYLPQVRSLTEKPLSPEVLAIALRYVWLTEPNPDIQELRPYLNPQVDPIVRSTAAALMLRRGDPRQKAEATETLRRMLTHERERERVMGCRALGDAVYLQSLRLYIEPLLQDESLRVRCAMLEAIAATHLEEYYPALLKGLEYKSTREAARQALVRLADDAIPLLTQLIDEVHTSEGLRTQAWITLSQIGTVEAFDVLVSHLTTAWGGSRRNLLQILLKLPDEAGVDAVSDMLGRSGIETLIDQELKFLAHIYAGLRDLDPGLLQTEAAHLLHRALRDLEVDAQERLFLLMRFLYDSNKIQAAAFSLQSSTRESVARGLEILDNTLDIAKKQALLGILDRQSFDEKLRYLSEFVPYRPMSPNQRLRHLVELRYFLSDWVLACCFHLATQSRWSLTAEQILSCLRSPTGFVREAVLDYLKAVSPRVLRDLLPRLQHDPDPLVTAQAQQIMADLGLAAASTSSASAHPPHLPGLEPV